MREYTPTYSQETKDKVRKWHTGRKLTPDAIRKRSEKQRGAGSGRWTGDDITEDGVHQWIRYNFGRADHCDLCGKVKQKGDKNKFHWSNRDHKYTRDLQQWWQLCAKCHARYDKLILGKKDRWQIQRDNNLTRSRYG